jgi:hypothetical protein
MPQQTFVKISAEEPAQLRAALRRARDGDLLALPILRLWALGRTPTALAAVLLCSRSRVYRTVRADRTGTLGLAPAEEGPLSPPLRTPGRVPTLRRSLGALLQAPPRASGWCRTRWSGATLALTWQTTRGLRGSAETRRRGVPQGGWVWTRAPLVAKDDDPQRVARLARLRDVFEPRTCGEAMVLADALEIHVLPTGGCAWRPTGTQLGVMPPGQQQTPSLAGALDLNTGTWPHGLGPRQTQALFRHRLTQLQAREPADRYTRLDGVVEHDTIHQAPAVEPWLAAHPRVTRRWLPTSWPRANPIARACGDGHDGCTRHHPRTRRPDLVADGEDHVPLHGPWKYRRSDLYDEPAVTATVEKIAQEEHGKTAA